MLRLSPLHPSDLEEIVQAFRELGWHKTRELYEHYLREQSAGQRSCLVARAEERFAGYVTVVWRSEYASFAASQIGEVKDLNVLPRFRRCGIGRALMESAESLARTRGHGRLGLGVALLADYGSAQRLYAKLGYLPDGAGLHHGSRAIRFGEAVPADDDLVLYLSKQL